MPAPVEIHCSRFLPTGYADWETICRLCDERYWCEDWMACMEHALGHLAFMHPRT